MLGDIVTGVLPGRVTRCSFALWRACVLALDPGLFGVARKEEPEWMLAD